MNNKMFNLTASEIMTKSPTTGNKNMLVGEVLNIMNSKKAPYDINIVISGLFKNCTENQL